MNGYEEIDTNSPEFHLTFEFAKATRRRDIRVMLAQAGFAVGETITVVTAETVVDEEVLRRQDRLVVRHAPQTEIGWEVLPRLA
jgi:hypothetical protein